MQEREIELAVETDVVTFFNPVKDGWLGKRSDSAALSKWKRRWFLLNDNCLYYFNDPNQEINDASPRAIFPLDNTAVEKVAGDRLRVFRYAPPPPTTHLHARAGAGAYNLVAVG